jgi:hypothetical protein
MLPGEARTNLPYAPKQRVIKSITGAFARSGFKKRLDWRGGQSPPAG